MKCVGMAFNLPSSILGIIKVFEKNPGYFLCNSYKTLHNSQIFLKTRDIQALLTGCCGIQ